MSNLFTDRQARHYGRHGYLFGYPAARALASVVSVTPPVLAAQAEGTVDVALPGAVVSRWVRPVFFPPADLEAGLEVVGTAGQGADLVRLTFRNTLLPTVATALLTSDTVVPTANDTVTIGTTTYTFKATALTPAEGEVLIGASADATLLNLSRAINRAGGVLGTDYQVAAAHPLVSAGPVVAHTILLTARAAGTTVATTEASTHLSFASVSVSGAQTITGAARTWTARLYRAFRG